MRRPANVRSRLIMIVSILAGVLINLQCSLDLVPDNLFGPEVHVHPNRVTLIEGRCGYIDINTQYGLCEPWTYYASSSNESIARVGCPGPPWNTDTLPANIVAISPGRATLTYKIWCGDMSALDQVTIQVTAAPARSLTLSVDTATVVVDGLLWIEAYPKDKTGHALFAHDVTWSSADTAVASAVRADWFEGKPIGIGRVWGLRAGHTRVTATVDGVSASAQITVIDST